jgi:signal transduction histidine kinase
MEERARLARDLHDSVTQLLYSAALFSTGAKKFINQNKLEPAVQYLDQIEQVTQQALREMRLMVFELRSASLPGTGLVGEIQSRLDAVERRSGISASFHAENLPGLSPRLEDTLFRFVTEALNNALKHAFARGVEVLLTGEDGKVSLEVKDNGVGFEISEGKRSGGLGLASMRERIEQIGGTFSIESSPGSGTRVQAVVPIDGGGPPRG